MRRSLCRLLFLLGDTFSDVPGVVMRVAFALDSRGLFVVALGGAKAARWPGRVAWWLFPETCAKL